MPDKLSRNVTRNYSPPPLSSDPRLISNMVFHMPSQIGRPPEGLPTRLTFEGPLSGVKSPVASEMGMFAKGFPTNTTLVAACGYTLECSEPAAPVKRALVLFVGLLSTQS